MNGVTVRFSGSKNPGSNRVHDVLDCRLALALGEWTRLLQAYGVVEVVHMSMHRANATIGRSGKPSQHAAGLAIDVGELRLSDGSRFVVKDDWSGAIGEPVCGVQPTAGARRPAATLRAIVCETARRQIFRVILTPNYNQAHHNHFHFDLSPGRPVLAPR